MVVTVMHSFISEIRKHGCEELLCSFSQVSIDMFRKNQWTSNFVIPYYRFGKKQTATVMVTAWDLLDIEYLSILHSNDYRHSKKAVSFGQFVNLYRKYENENSIAPVLKTVDGDGMFRAIMGMTAEQFLYQDLSWLFEKFNRDYYILHAAGYEIEKEINLNSIAYETFGLCVDEYIAILVMIWGLCAQGPDPMDIFKRIVDLRQDSVFSECNVLKVLQYYSCTYEELRKSSIKKQLLYSKPFILTQSSKTYIASSLFLVAMTMANGLYWLGRDYYRKKKSTKFINTFGLLFEEYIKELSTSYCSNNKWCVLEKGRQKGADYYYDFGALRMIVEAKSALLKLDAKQQVPNLDSANTFFLNTILESYDQLNSSYYQLNKKDGIPTIKIILLYDEFSNTGIIEKSLRSVFEADRLCFIMTIREFEILLYLHCNDQSKFDQVIKKICECIEGSSIDKNIGAILESMSIYDNIHLKGSRDFFSSQLRKIRVMI